MSPESSTTSARGLQSVAPVLPSQPHVSPAPHPQSLTDMRSGRSVGEAQRADRHRLQRVRFQTAGDKKSKSGDDNESSNRETFFIRLLHRESFQKKRREEFKVTLLAPQTRI